MEGYPISAKIFAINFVVHILNNNETAMCFTTSKTKRQQTGSISNRCTPLTYELPPVLYPIVVTIRSRVCFGITYTKIGTIQRRQHGPCARMTRKFVKRSKFFQREAALCKTTLRIVIHNSINQIGVVENFNDYNQFYSE